MLKKLVSGLLILSLVCSGIIFYPVVTKAENSESNNGLNITSDGFASATIALTDDASDMEKRAAEELQYHVQKVSGATLPIKIGNDDSTDSFYATFASETLSATTLGYHSISLMITNKTEEDVEVTIEQTDIKENTPQLTIMGESGVNTPVLLKAQSSVQVYGVVYIDDLFAFNTCPLVVNIMNGTTTLAKATTNIICAASDSLLTNGDFENITETGMFEDWLDTHMSVPGNLPYDVVDEDVHGGSYAIEYWAGASNPFQYNEWVRTTKNTSYTISFWAKSASAAAVKLQLYDFYGASDKVTTTSPSIKISNNWQRYEYSFTTYEEEAPDYVGVWMTLLITGSVVLDDFIFVETPTDKGNFKTPTIDLPSNISNTIVIATPDSFPALEEMFAEDLAWLRATGQPGDTERYGDDGFAIRRIGNTIYIFGANERGALNGVYDFIEENMGVLWTRANEDIGLVYDEMPTIIASGKGIDNREKSPFSVRGWHLCGTGENGVAHTDPATEIMMVRNKMNAKFAEPCNKQCWEWQESIGLTPFQLTHNVVDLILSSPSYDSSYTNYWSTDKYGNQHGPHEEDWLDRYDHYQINWWDQGENGYDDGKTGKTLQTLIDSVLDFLEKNPNTKYVGVGINDFGAGYQYPEQNNDFEYAEGKIVSHTADNYKSTVCFSFINKVARVVAEQYPDVLINAYAYTFTQIPPECDIEDNICIVFAPIHEDVTDPINPTGDSPNKSDFVQLDGWTEKSNNIVTYNYYSCFPNAHTQYERPIADKIQGDMMYYVEHGFTGLVPEGIVDAQDYKDAWAMNALTFWIYQKLTWNPYEDIEDLIKEFCDKCYGDASEYMQEYYGYVKKSWDEGKEGVNLVWNTKFSPTYYNNFIKNSQYIQEMLYALEDAMGAANDLEKQRIRYIKETFEGHVTFFEMPSMREYDVAKYRSTKPYTYPEREGMLFAGWYTDAELTQPLGGNVTTGTAYAKFVDASVLDVKAQITADTTVQSKKTDIRFVSTVNDLNYKEVGFVFDIEGRGEQTKSTHTVYERLYAVNGEQVDTILPSEFSNESSYFYAFTYYNVPNANFETVFDVTPYWITLDGTTVYGDSVQKTIKEGAVNGLIGGEIGREDGEKW